MLKQFIASIIILLAFNFVYKGIRYFMYNRADGVVTHHESVLIHYTVRNRDGSDEAHQKWMTAPVIAFKSGKEEITFNLAELEMVEFLDDDDEVTVLYDRAKGEYNVATIINFWLTFQDIAFGIIMAIVGPIAFEIYKAIKKWFASME